MIQAVAPFQEGCKTRWLWLLGCQVLSDVVTTHLAPQSLPLGFQFRTRQELRKSGFWDVGLVV